MGLDIKKAVRELVFTKIALMGASGSGKSYSALRLATGMASELEKILNRPAKILMINTEKSRGLYYANEFTYDIAAIDAPHEPEKYAGAIYDAVELGYDILIMDGTSPEWEGDGGCLALHQMAGGKYQDWGKVTPRHDKFLLAIAESPIHIIATMRGKDQYEMENTNGRVSVTKLGVGAKQREGFEYEFTTTFLLDQKDNFATEQKDNTHLFEKVGRVLLTEEHGSEIIKWANSGTGYTPKVYKPTLGTPESTLPVIRKEIITKVKEKGGSKNPKLVEVFTKANVTMDSKGVNSIESITVATELLKGIDQVERVE